MVKIEGPDYEPRRISIRTLEPGPPPTPTPSPTPTPEPTPTPPPIPAPQGASIRSAAGAQAGAPGSFCWSEQIGGRSECFTNESPSQASALAVRSQEKVLLSIQAQMPPDRESIRPFQETRSGFPDHQIDPALETELTIDLPEGIWSMDVCATWHGRGQPICWLFKLDVAEPAPTADPR